MRYYIIWCFFKNLKVNQLREMRFIVVVMIGLECVSRDEQ